MIFFHQKIQKHLQLRASGMAACTACGFLAMGVSARADVFSNVPSAAGYQIAYELAIPVNGAFQGATPVPYSVNNSSDPALAVFDRVAYYLELTNGSGTTWVYASMDAFTASPSQTGLPHDIGNPVTFQQSVSNLTVLSNVAGVRNGSFDRGQIEMWHHTYNAGNTNLVFAASADTYDWGDNRVDTGVYGSFQIHNPASRQVVLAYNRWASSAATNDDVGIGNSSGANPDWTFAANTPTYTARKLVVLLRPKRFNVTLTASPMNQQVTPRNTTTNLATVPISGTEALGGFDKAVLKILRNGLAYGTATEQNLSYSAGSASFSFSPAIPAELASYTFELYLKQGTELLLVRTFSDVTAGDVYLWSGQSNSQSALFSGSSDAYLSPWIRTFGMSSDSATVTQAYNFWVEADGDGSLNIPSGIGQWPLVVGRKIVDTVGIPVAILNGSRGGYNMTQLQRDDANPDNLADTGTTTYRVYNRLRYRAIQAKVAGSVRGIFFYQGESDRNNASQHVSGFASLMADWKLDYPAIERVFVSQVHVGCGSYTTSEGTFRSVDQSLPELRNAQRLFEDVYEPVRVMSTNGLTTHTDNCHFPFPGGYETHGLNTFRQVHRELYGAPDSPAIDPPNPAFVEFSASNKIRIVLRKSGAGVTVDAGSLVDFRLNGSSASLLSATVTPNAIELTYNGSVATATSLDYLAHIGSAGGWVRNSNGVGLLTFSEPIVGEPIIDDVPEITLISPTALAEVAPGSVFPLSASATSPVTAITRMEIFIDGILHTAVNSSGSIAANWTVPASGAHRILFRCTNAAARSVEKSVVIRAGITTAPGGVSSGLNVWLRPESGIIRDASGAVSAWQDSSGNNNGCIQAATASKPTYIEGAFGIMPGLSFDGGDILTATAGMSTGSYTKIVRVSMAAFDGSRNILSSGGAASGPVRHALFTSSSAFPRLWHNASFVVSSTAMVANQSNLLIGTYNADTNSGTLYLNGIEVGTGTPANGDNGDPTYHLGGIGGANFLRGSIGEAIIYNRVINSTERASIEAYLNAKTVAPPTAPQISYSTWSGVNIVPPADASAEGDANGNGIPNLIEFALGLNSQNPRKPLEIETVGGMVKVRYLRPTDRTGITYQLLESSDLAIWTPVADTAGPVNAGIEERGFARPLSATLSTFYKLRVSMP